MTLYEIDKALMDFEFEVDEETGEILNASELDDLNLAREQKIENIGLYIKNLEAEKEAVKNEKNSFADRQKRLEKKIESLKGYLTYALQGEKFSTPRVAVSFRKSESVLVKDKFLIPDHYMNISVVREPNKTAIKNAIKRGEDILGVELIEKKNVSVK